MKKITNLKYRLKYDYYATEDGKIWSSYSQKFISSREDKDGYLKVRLASPGFPSGRWTVSLHRLILSTYCPIEGMELLQVNHIDGNKKNNSLSNLEWVTCQENITHACENDLRAKINGGAKLTPGNVREICKALEQGASNIELGEKYGVHPDTIGRIRRGRSWKEISKDYNIQ